MLDIDIIKCLEDNYSYLLRDKETNLVGVVDPSEFKPVNFIKSSILYSTHTIIMIMWAEI